MLASLALTAGLATSAAWPRPADLPPACAEAHEDHLAGDFAAFSSSLVACLADPATPPLVEKNALELLQSAYEQTGGRLPGAFRLPEGLEKLRLVQRRTQSRSQVDYVVEFTGNLAGGRQIAALKLERASGEVLLDKADGRYEFGESATGFYLKRVDQAPQPEGLYKVTVQLKDGERIEALVPVVDWASDASPVIEQPQDFQSVTATPELQWRPFSTGERGYESRRFSADVIHNDAPDYAWDKVWWLWGGEGDATRAVVGKTPKGQGAARLGTGRHLFVVTYMETRSFGGLVISKSSSARVSFHVR